MDAQTIDQEFGKLQSEFQDVATTVAALAEKLEAADAAGDANAKEWLSDLEVIAKDIDDEQAQAKSLLLAIHGFITNAAQEAAQEKPPLYAPGHDPDDDQQQAQQQQQPQHHGLFGGMLGGGMMGGGMGGGMFGGGMMGGYGGGGFAQAMEMGAGMSLGANLIGSIFR